MPSCGQVCRSRRMQRRGVAGDIACLLQLESLFALAWSAFWYREEIMNNEVAMARRKCRADPAPTCFLLCLPLRCADAGNS
jgi:hypothetical protein